MNKQSKPGLRPLPPDNKDFSYQKVFGAVKVPDIDFGVGIPLKIEDQKETDYCAAMASSSVAEDHEEIDLDPLFSFAAIKSIDKQPQEWGSDLRSTCKAATKIGFIEKKDSPYTIDDPREKIVYLNNWPSGLIEKAEKHKQASYFRVDEGKDIYEAFRGALWQNRATRCSILTGVVWREGWTKAPNGIIPLEETEQWFGHAMKIFGQKTINEKIYLMAQLSNGTEEGDKGLFYFPKEVINRDFTLGAFQFNDMPVEEAKKKTWSKWQRFIETLKKYLEEILK